ncbi:MAG: chromosomal replication initiator protein dnaA 1 [Chlamydiota bacterium]|jgi:chromosomal replication initiator protein
MLTKTPQETWSEFLQFIQEKCSAIEVENWFASISVLDSSKEDELCLEIPNIFVQDYILTNYKKELLAFVPARPSGEPAVRFIIKQPAPQKAREVPKEIPPPATQEILFNPAYTFDNFIEGPSNQFVKSAAMGVASKPCKSYNPLFIHGGVGLGKTHLLHAIGHHIQRYHKRLKIHCITTEGFINDLVEHLRSKSIDKMKRFYRSLDVLMVDDIQFLQNRLNFEDEFCNTFESLINQNKQIIITSDKPPSHLKLSERLVGRMEWGLVTQIGAPELETRVAILQHKAEARGFHIPQQVAFFIAERIFNNVRQLEGAINRLSAYCRLMGLEVTENAVENILGELFSSGSTKKLSVDNILKSVASIFGVKINDLKGNSRTKDIALPRQVAMYLAKELLSDSLSRISSAFGGKTHSTLLHAWKKVAGQVEKDEDLRKQVDLAKRKLEDE